MEKVLIVGGSNQLGKCLKKDLSDAGFDIVSYSYCGLDLPLNILDKNKVLSVFDSQKPNYVINLSSSGRFSNSTSENEEMDINAIGVKNILDAAYISDSKITVVNFFPSSCLEGELLSSWDVSKLAGYQYCNVFKNNLSTKCLNIFCPPIASLSPCSSFCVDKIISGVSEIQQSMLRGFDWSPLTVSDFNEPTEFVSASFVSKKALECLEKRILGDVLIDSNFKMRIVDLIHELFQLAGIDGAVIKSANSEEVISSYVVRFVGAPLVTREIREVFTRHVSVVSDFVTCRNFSSRFVVGDEIKNIIRELLEEAIEKEIKKYGKM